MKYHRLDRSEAGLLVAMLCLLLLFGFLLVVRTPDAMVVRSGQSATATPPTTYASAILTQQEALALSMERFPPGGGAYGEQVRLVTPETYSSTLQSPLPSGWESLVPIWVVAILGTGLEVADIVHVPGSTASDWSDTRPAVGAEYIWDAQSGLLIAEYGLLNLEAYNLIASLPNQPLHIQLGTLPPPLPTDTSTP